MKNADAIPIQSNSLSFVASSTQAPLWPYPSKMNGSSFHVFDTENRIWADLDELPGVEYRLASFVFTSTQEGPEGTIIAIGGPGKKAAFQMWRYVVGCPACSPHGTCVNNSTYCTCDSSRYGGNDCSADCGEPGCGLNGYCMPTQDGPKCQCKDGFIGDRCDVPFACEGDGTLFNVNGTAQCKCRLDSGPRCQFRS
jgi:hypothetical protein